MIAHRRSPAADAPPPCGCALLQWLRDQLAEGRYATTGGDYLETIFTHREAFLAYPPAHRACARGFTDLARALEVRAWTARDSWREVVEWHGAPAASEAVEPRPDWEGDSEAVVAFRHEAWVIANM